MLQVAKKLVKEAESNIGKKEYDANDGLVRHSDATKIQVRPVCMSFPEQLSAITWWALCLQDRTVGAMM